MSERKVNLEEILRNKIGYMGNEPKLTKLISERATGYDVLSAMKEACSQILELAAANATVMNDPNSYCGNTGSEYAPDVIVNKESILNVIDLIE